jgi:phosphoenolpyruvate carboxykinase (GTP)
MQMLHQNTVFTNVARTSDGDVWWEGMTKEIPTGLTSWTGDAFDETSGELAAHPNARFTSPLSQCPSLSSEWDDPEGVVVDAIIFGGRRSTTIPLVVEARSWNHGVFLGATIASERTAAAEGTLGEVRRDPFAMLPFCGYNMGDYLQHWLTMGDRVRVTGRPPRIFQVNWFQKDEQGRFLWPGFGENSRVVEWIVDRLEGQVAATETPIGWVPKKLNLSGLDISDAAVEQLLGVDRDAVSRELDDAEAFLSTFGDRLPETVTQELNATRARLNP